MQNYNSKFKIDINKRCLLFGIRIIRFCETFPQKRIAWILVDQLVRCCTSIGANIIEAKASSSRLEYKRFYEIALKSSNESLYWLEMIKEIRMGDQKELEEIIQEATEINKMVASGVIKLKNLNSKL